MLMITLVVSLPAMATKHTIKVQNYTFLPSALSGVNVGDTIHWLWVSGTHTTTSTTIPSGAATWDHPMTSSSQTYDYKVLVSGVYNYQCTPHAAMGMVASFTVSSAATLSVTPGNQNVGANAGSTSFSVATGSSWSAVSNATWCTVTASGTGNGTITADYTSNTSVSVRTAVITVTVSGLPVQTTTVTQSGAAPVLNVTPSNQNVTSTAGEASFAVTSNTSWTSTSNVSWCSTTASGLENGSLIASYQENTGSAPRVATITVMVDGLSPKTITVTQDGSGVGISELTQGPLLMYPNPTEGLVTLNPGEDMKMPVNISIYDISGKPIIRNVISDKKEVRYDLSAYPEGVYFVRIISGEKIMTGRLIRK